MSVETLRPILGEESGYCKSILTTAVGLGSVPRAEGIWEVIWEMPPAYACALIKGAPVSKFIEVSKVRPSVLPSDWSTE
jgi:hypothetical protein